MSYLDGPRITFAGRFLGDVPTANNTPGQFAGFGPLTAPLWNPEGGGTFDLLGCRVTGGESAPGAPVPADDPVRRLAVVGAGDRPGAKLVDLDPAWQRSSEIWGLGVRLIDPDTGEELLSGSYRTAAFRDVWTRQADGGPLNGQGSGASYTSVLDDVVFGPGCAGYPVLAALRDAAPTPRLSIVLNVFGFYYNHVEDRFATGSLTGCIGPWKPGEPLGFVAGRRLVMGNLGTAVAPQPFGPSVAVLDDARVVLDLGNAYPISDAEGTRATFAEIAPAVEALELGLLAGEPGAVGSPVPAGFDVLGEIDLTAAAGRAGIVSVPLGATPPGTVAGRPLALFARPAGGQPRRIVSREPTDGLYVRADDFVHRLDPPTTATTTLHAVLRGVPERDRVVHLRRVAGSASVLTVDKEVKTGPDGTATVTIGAADPGSPRAGLDGVVERVVYSPRRGQGDALDFVDTGLNPALDVIVAHVREHHEVPPHPDWVNDVQPILARYARLYPIMGEHLADLGEIEAVSPYRTAMIFALTRPIDDPNHMPVTRDLSGPRRDIILRWLEQLPAAPGGMARSLPVPKPPTAEPDAKSEAADDAVRLAVTPSTEG